MAELYPIEDVLDKLAGFSGIQRVFLSTSGTLQTALSAYFGTAVKVKVVYQTKRDDAPQYTRRVDMFIKLSALTDLVVCRANSEVYCSKPHYRAAIEKGEMGIGQIMAYYDLRPAFELISAEMRPDEREFSRTYWLKSDDLTYQITETFPLELYP